MKTKNIFKTLALAMLMPATMLNTACSNEDDNLINNDSNNQKGYELPVTVNVTRQGDATTRATYTDNGNGTGSLGFSTGDKLFVSGNDASAGGAGFFAGTLDWVSDGTFRGTLTLQNTSYTGTADALLTAASSGGSNYVSAQLLPAGYEGYPYLSIANSGYNAFVNPDASKAFAPSKKLGVEQLSWEYANSYSSGTGFTLAPQNAILNFTISGLTASTEVTATLKEGSFSFVSGNVTTNSSGIATFAMGLTGGKYDLHDFTLTVGGHDFPLASSSKEAQAGKIYNISRNGAKTLAEVGNEDLGKVIAADGKVYANATAATAAGTTARAIITYVGSATGEGSPYNHGLALALTNVSGDRKMWKTEQSDASHNHKPKDINSFQSESGLQYNSTHNNTTYPAFKAAMDYSPAAPTTYGCSVWFLPTAYQWKQMIDAADSWANLRTRANLSNGYYWTSSEYNTSDAWCIYSSWAHGGKNVERFVRSALAF